MDKHHFMTEERYGRWKYGSHYAAKQTDPKCNHENCYYYKYYDADICGRCTSKTDPITTSTLSDSDTENAKYGSDCPWK